MTNFKKSFEQGFEDKQNGETFDQGKSIEEIVNDYIESCLQYGHKAKEWNPKMASYIQDELHGYHLIDLVQTYQFLKHVSAMLKQKAEKSAKILFVGTSKASSRLIKQYAQECNSYYINYRWLGGMLTNWPTLQKRIERFKDLKSLLANKEKPNLSKKEYNGYKKEFEKLKKLFSGIENMTKLPDIVIFTSQLKDYLAINECTKLGIACVAITDTNCDPDLVPYPIPGNDDSPAAVEFVLKNLSAAINAGYNKKKS